MASYSYLDPALFRKIISGGAAHLKAHKAEVNNLNVFPVPDGDTGDNMYMTISAGVAAMERSSAETLGETAAALSRGMLLGARGNSGVILSQFFSGIAKVLTGRDSADAELLKNGFDEGVKCAYSAVATPTEGTMLTVARVGAAGASAAECATVNELIENTKAAMESALANTPNQLPVLKEAGVVDSGGAGICYIFEGMANVLSGKEEELSAAASDDNPTPKTDSFSSFTKDSVMTYGYCTEFLLQLQTSKVDPDSFDEKVITDYLTTVGDSIVSFKDGTVVKVHVHTLTPEKVLGFCRQFGEFLTVKIENMSVQHSSRIAGDGSREEAPDQSKSAEPEKEYAVISVCSGDGIKATLEEIGVDLVIDGGQTNNPSAEDFIEAFGRVNARHIFVFPNNANIILAARQAAELYDRADVHVFKNKDLGSGYVGAASVDRSAASADEIISAVGEAMAEVVTGCVSPAVRTTSVGGVKIECGDNICFVGKTMIASKKKRTDALRALADHILGGGEKFMATAFFGEEMTAAERDEFGEYMAKEHPDVEYYTVDGGQPVYSCILVAE